MLWRHFSSKKLRRFFDEGWAGERKYITVPRITARFVLAKDSATIQSRNLRFSGGRGSFSLVSPIWLWPDCSYIHQVSEIFFFPSLLKAEMCFLTGPANALSGLSKAIYTAWESFRLSLGLQEWKVITCRCCSWLQVRAGHPEQTQIQIVNAPQPEIKQKRGTYPTAARLQVKTTPQGKPDVLWLETQRRQLVRRRTHMKKLRALMFAFSNHRLFCFSLFFTETSVLL